FSHERCAGGEQRNRRVVWVKLSTVSVHGATVTPATANITTPTVAECPRLQFRGGGRDVNRLSARELFEDIKERMALRWVAGQSGADRALQAGGAGQRRPSEIGYLNIIYPNKLQIVGGEELNYLDGLDSRQRWETVQKIFGQ